MSEKMSRNSCPKRVVFADQCGYQLVTIRFISCQRSKLIISSRFLLNSFWVPKFHLGCVQKTNDVEIKLLGAVITGDYSQLVGSIWLRNSTAKRIIFVRLSLDNWQTFRDVLVESPSDREISDFSVQLGNQIISAVSIQFCLCVRTFKNSEIFEEFWDNNRGYNFEFARQ